MSMNGEGAVAAGRRLKTGRPGRRGPAPDRWVAAHETAHPTATPGDPAGAAVPPGGGMLATWSRTLDRALDRAVGGTVDAVRSVAGSPDRGEEPVRAADTMLYEGLSLLDSDTGGVVLADDGVPLAVRSCGPADAELTLVFAHGYCLQMGSWHFQRRQLADMWGDRIRLVFYDQRGHGRSGDTARERSTIGQLGDDLATVIRSEVPRGRILLVGHSMGGMTVMAFARRHPDLFHERVVGVCLAATAAGGLSADGLARALDVPLVSALASGVGRLPLVADRGRRLFGGLISPVLRWSSFGEATTDRSVAALSEAMLNETSVTTVSHFFVALREHDESAALPVLLSVPVTIIVGTRDIITPPARSREMHASLPQSELVTVRNSGHMVQLEQPTEVSAAIGRLIGRLIASDDPTGAPFPPRAGAQTSDDAGDATDYGRPAGMPGVAG